MNEFSCRTRAQSLARFSAETFDLLVVGGGITGAAVARDAASRGLKVALVESRDFAWGTSSRSSKLVHGGLRYLENLEFALVFEALSERANLLKTVPHMVRPLKFYFPVYEGDKHGKGVMGLGMWIYDLLAMFRTPGFHKSLSRKEFIETVPFLRREGLVGGFSYYDASMWDDVLAVQILRSASSMGAAVVNYVEAFRPVFEGERVAGFIIRDREKPEGKGDSTLRAHQTVICAGPWTDLLGSQASPRWHEWLVPSKGVHLVFDHKKIPVDGAIVMNHPDDGRIIFVIPRLDYGTGVTIVGTTDGPSAKKPEDTAIETGDVHYLMKLLERYFPELNLVTTDIVSAYVGVRPLMGPHAADQTTDANADVVGAGGAHGQPDVSLQKVSREHHIGEGPGGTVWVAGGKYTTHRTMAEEIVDFAIQVWHRDFDVGKIKVKVPRLSSPKTKGPVNPMATPQKIAAAHRQFSQKELVERYGAETLDIIELSRKFPDSGSPSLAVALDGDVEALPGFPELEAQLRHTMRTELVMHLEDFYFRRVPLYLARSDHGISWAAKLAKVWAEERGLTDADAARELEQLDAEIERRSSWKKGLFK